MGLIGGVIIGMRIAGGPQFFPSALKRMPAPTAIVTPRSQLEESPQVSVEKAPPLPEPVARPLELARVEPRPSALTREIFLCQGYSGQTFWSSSTCSGQRATIDRIVTVPGQMSWEDAVAMGEQVRRNAASLQTPANVATTAGAIGGNGSTSSGSNACRSLASYIEQLDASARQPHSAQVQDQLRRERQQARDRQSAMRC